MMIKEIISIYAFLLLGPALGQVGCVEEVREAKDLCLKAGNTCTVSEIISRAENFVLDPPHETCLDRAGYFLALADFCAVSIEVPGSSPDEVIRALDKAIQFVERSGEMKPALIQKEGEGAIRMVELYEYKVQVYLSQKDAANYELAKEKREFWIGVFNGPKLEIPESNPRSPDNRKETKKDTLSHRNAIIQALEPASYTVKPIVVITNSTKDQMLLSNGMLKISAEPSLELIPSGRPERPSYLLSFKNSQNYLVTLSHPEFEEQFFDFSTDQVRSGDTLFIHMYVRGTPCFYTRYDKRSFVPDPFSILVVRNRYGSEKDFNTLIEELDLQVDPANRILYHKRSGEAFDSKEDPVLTKLRGRSDLVEVAGHNLRTRDKINILTNQFRIIWDQKQSAMPPEEAAQIEAIFREYQIKELSDNLFEAHPGIGLGLNDLVERLNKTRGVYLAYPESFEPIHPD